jgi:hypothetical protein
LRPTRARRMSFAESDLSFAIPVRKILVRLLFMRDKATMPDGLNKYHGWQGVLERVSLLTNCSLAASSLSIRANRQ